MNRRERRSAEKMLGLSKHYKHLSRTAKWELQADRIKLGKERQEEFIKNVNQSIQEQDEATESKTISVYADLIAKTKKVPMAEAIEEAKKEYTELKASREKR